MENTNTQNVHTLNVNFLCGEEPKIHNIDIQLTCDFDKERSESQVNEIKSLINDNIDPLNSVVIIFNAEPGKSKELKEVLLRGPFHKPSAENLVDIIEIGDKVAVVLKLKENISKLIKVYSKSFLTTGGLGELFKNQDNRIDLNVSSSSNFEDIADELIVTKDYGRAFGRSLKGKASIKYHKDLPAKVKKICKILKKELPDKLNFLFALKHLDLEYGFETYDEVPQVLQDFFQSKTEPIDPPSNVKKDIEELVELMGPEIDAFFTVENALAIKCKINFPHFGKFIKRRLK